MIVTRYDAVQTSRGLCRAAHDLTATCMRVLGKQDAPELHEPVPDDMRMLIEKLNVRGRR